MLSQTVDMNLPRFIFTSLSVRARRFQTNFLAIGIVVLFCGMMPCAFAGTAKLSYSPSDLRFGDIVVGQSESLPVVVTNNEATSVSISGITVGNSTFSVSGVSLPLTLPVGQSFELNVTFTPTANGWVGSPIKFSVNGASTNGLEVEGTGVNSQPVTAFPSAVSFGQVALGSTSTTQVVLTNMRSGRINLSGISTSGSGFSASGLSFPMTLGAGQSVTLNVAFTPQSANASEGSLFVAGAQLSIPLAGTGAASGQLTASPASLAFGSVQSGQSATLTDSLINTGAASVTISQATVTGTGFSVSGLNLPLVLNPGASVTFTTMFAPPSAMNATGAITVSSNASNSMVTVALSGTGTAQGQLIIAPTAVNFGNTNVGSTVSQTSSISATGASVTVSSANLNSNEFSVSGISLPMTIPAGQSVPVTMTFSPQTSGTANAVLSVTSNAANNAAQNLSGNGVTPPQHSVSLSWTDTNSGVAGYNVYRGSTSGGPYAQINSGLDATTSYNDTAVVAGQTYYYVATAVDGSGAESGYSNEAQGAIPTP